MPHLVTGKRQRIHAPAWAEDEWVELRQLSWGEKQRLTDLLISLEGEIDDEKGFTFASSQKIHTASYNSELLRCAIVDWHLLDEGGKPIKLLPENIALLTEEDGDFILEAATALNPPRRRRGESSEPPSGKA